MSVLVKGMDMPKICNKCDFCTYVEKDRDVWCTSTIRIIKRDITRPEYEYQDLPRPDWCPLVEVKTPHGRLIDADALVPDICHDWNGYRVPNDDYSCECIHNAPTVIEAED